MFSNKDVIGKIICSKSIASKTLRALIIKVSPVIQNLTLGLGLARFCYFGMAKNLVISINS